MFCPHCGQQQLSNDVRFCSRCGFALVAVNELLAHGGTLPGRTIEANNSKRSARHEGARKGVLLFLIGIVLVPALLIIIGTGDPETFPTLLIPLAAVICFLGGIMRLIYALLFEEGLPRELKAPQEQLFATAEQIAFRASAQRAAQLPPPQQATPVADYLRPQVRTAEMVRPPSVTENTTTLFDKERDPRAS